jgi:hypothetical protein
VRRKNFVPSDTAVLCSRHFREEDIDRTSIATVRIRENAVPCIFPAFPTYLKKSKKARKPPMERLPPLLTCENTPSAASVDLPNCTSEQSCDLVNVDQIEESQSVIPVNNDHCYSAVPVTPRKAALKRKLTVVQRQLAVSRKKVKILMQSKRRLIARNASLKDVIAELRKQSLMGVDSLGILEKSACGVNDLLVRHVNKQLGRQMPTSYSAELRSFACKA